MSPRGRNGWSILPSSSIIAICLLLVFVARFDHVAGCQFYPIGEYLKFVRVPENLREGTEILSLEAHPRNRLTIIPVDKEEDSRFFSYRDVNGTHVSVTLAHSLEDLVDAESPRNLLKFRVICDYTDGRDTLVSSHLSVTVYVEDINDHAPQFVDAPYHVTVDELTPTGVTIFRGIHAIDGDKPNTPNSDIHYAIVKGNEQGKFSLESGHRTALILRKPLDYDNGDREFTLVITATDRGVPSKSSNATVKITVLDNDDLDPKFTRDVYKARIYEFYPMPERPIFAEINFTTPIHAVDRDHDINVSIRYDIISGNEGGYFHLDPKNGSLFLKRPIDLEAERNLPGNTFVLQIHASQIDNPLKMAMARVEVEVLDLNDNLPEFEVDLYNISIVENLPNGFSVLQVIARDKDQGENGEFDYRLDDPSGAFSMDPRSGWLTVKDQNVLDRERRDRLRMKVHAMEKTPSVVLIDGRRANGSTVDIHVSLLDANDNNPIFVPANLYELVARADAKIGTVLGQVHALDEDLGANGLVKYTLQKPGNSSTRTPPFAVDERTGVITVVASPIVEGRHAIFVEAADQPANPSERRFSLAVVTVDVFRPDGPDSWEPDFVGAPYEFWVGANVPVGTSVGQIRINDAVKTTDLIYDLLHSYQEGVPFAVEERSGTITVVDDIGRYDRSMYEFEGVVTDERDLTLITNVSIHVVDPNDERGALTKGTTTPPLVFHVKENVPGTYIGRVLPRNGTAATSYSGTRFLIVNQQDVPDISIMEDGALYAPNGLDREIRQNYSITVIAEGPKLLRVVQVRVIVDDENDHPPVFTSSSYEGRILENSPNGTEVIMASPIAASDKDEGINREFVFSLTGDGSSLFRIDPTNARVFFEGNDDARLNREERASYDLQVVAEDGGGLISNANLKIIIDDTNDNPPKFIRMIVLPDQGVKVSNQPDEESSSSKNSTAVDSTSVEENETKRPNERKSPLLLVPENVTIGAPIVRLLAEDKDEDSNAEISYSLQNETISGSNDAAVERSSKLESTGRRYFLLDSRTAEISVARALPPEKNVRLIVSAKDGGGLTDNITVRIHVVDVNDHAPVFDQSWYTFDVAEGTYMSHTIGTIRAMDTDFGANANVNYEILSGAREDDSDKDNASWIFDVGPRDGVLRVNGKLDREKIPVHRLILLAQDDGSPSLSSTVEVEVNVLDVNDNSPTFHGYDEIESDDRGIPIPVYRTSIFENSPIGTFVAKVYANDSDFAGNGNGLILFDLVSPAHDEKQYFTIDSKEGSIATIANLDYESTKNHRLLVTASDLGSPISMTSTAVVTVEIINVDDDEDEEEEDDRDDSVNEVQKVPTFRHRYYEVEVEENMPTPIPIVELDLADGYHNDHIRYSVVADGTDARDHFSIDSKNGSLYLIKNVDRETRDRYEARVRVDRVKHGRGMPVMIYPVVGERLNGLAPNEARVVVRVKDTNDNAPRFKSKGRPILAAIPTTAHYGYEVVKVEAEDPDEGINGEIRYQILGREDAPRFAIDPLSGQVRSVASFARDAGRVFGFDVKATDRRGAESGRSGIANVFVYVLDDQKQLVMVVGQKPIDIEPHLDNFTAALHNITGLDVRVRKLEPHIEKNLIDATSTDVYLYAIDPHLNVMIDMDTLHNVFQNKKTDIKRELEEYHVLDIAGNAPRKNQRYLLSTLEVGVVVLGCVVFVGALITALCVTCVRRNKRLYSERASRTPFVSRRRREKAMFSSGGPLGFALADSTLQKPPLFPTFVDGLHYDPEPYCTDMPRRQSICDHGSGCVRFHTMGGSSSKHAVRTTGSSKGLEASATSLHSSGQDSGIVARASCHCSHSSSPSSGESSNGYEDSLKSLQRRERSNNDVSRSSHDISSVVGRRANQAAMRRRQRFNSFSNLESVYSHEMTLQRDQRCCATEKRRKNETRGREHRRAHSEAENNITETVIHEHPGTELTLASSLPNTSNLHGATRTSHMLY